MMTPRLKLLKDLLTSEQVQAMSTQDKIKLIFLPGFSMAKEVCFWIHLCMQILGDVHVIPNIFWQIPANNRYNFLFLNFRKPTSKTFLQLMQPELYMDTIFRLEEEGKDSIIYAAQNILPEVRLALENTNLTLCEFIEKF